MKVSGAEGMGGDALREMDLHWKLQPGWGSDRWDREARFQFTVCMSNSTYSPRTLGSERCSPQKDRSTNFRRSWLLIAINILRRPSQTPQHLNLYNNLASYTLPCTFNERRNWGPGEVPYEPWLIWVQGWHFPRPVEPLNNAVGASKVGGKDSLMRSYLKKKFICNEKDILWTYLFTLCRFHKTHIYYWF